MSKNLFILQCFLKQKESGYGMSIVSLVIILLSLVLASFLSAADTSKSTTNALIDGNNVFYAAESGLNLRAEKLRKKFAGFGRPSGLSPGQLSLADPVTQANLSTCFSVPVNVDSPTDFGCENFASFFNEEGIRNMSAGGSNAVIIEQKLREYRTYYFCRRYF
ncbi:MAG: hypothetical protein HC778_03370 [Chamaesiphon sp. CSU_1_12]|nr:hypothetical protein [Chamaesiphon sp. CSU_1_12]